MSEIFGKLWLISIDCIAYHDFFVNSLHKNHDMITYLAMLALLQMKAKFIFYREDNKKKRGYFYSITVNDNKSNWLAGQLCFFLLIRPNSYYCKTFIWMSYQNIIFSVSSFIQMHRKYSAIQLDSNSIWLQDSTFDMNKNLYCRGSSNPLHYYILIFLPKRFIWIAIDHLMEMTWHKLFKTKLEKLEKVWMFTKKHKLKDWRLSHSQCSELLI